MTGPGPVRKLSISVPQDVAERLARSHNASGYVTDAVRARMRAEELDALLAARGMSVTPEGRARAAAARAAAAAEWTPERWEQLRERVRRDVAEMFPEPEPPAHASAA
jgi:hypothetical protein